MTVEDMLPVLIVAGYVGAIAVGTLGSRLRAAHPPPDTVDGEPIPQTWEGQERHRMGTLVLTVGWLLGIAVSLYWLVVAVGWGALLWVVGLVVGVPSVIAFVVALISAARRRRGAGPSGVLWMLGTAAGVALLVVATHLTVNGVSGLAGYAHETELHVTDVHTTRKKSSYVTGTYLFDGKEHVVEGTWWGAESPSPRPGEVVPVWVTPLWPHPVLTGDLAAWRLLLFAGGAWLGGALCLVGSLRERRHTADQNRSIAERQQERTL